MANHFFKNKFKKTKQCSAQEGAASVEYIVVTLMVIVALFIPMGGPGSLSALEMLLQGLRNFQMHSTYLLSLP